MDEVKQGEMDYQRFAAIFKRAVYKAKKEMERETTAKLTKTWTQFMPVVTRAEKSLTETIKSRFAGLELMAEEQSKVLSALQAQVEGDLEEEERRVEKAKRRQQR